MGAHRKGERAVMVLHDAGRVPDSSLLYMTLRMQWRTQALESRRCNDKAGGCGC